MKRNIKDIVLSMTLEEKASLCSGLDFWHTKAIDRLHIPSIMMTDGPHGLRKQDEKADNLGINNSVPATCFPSAAGMACSWDRELIRNMGVAIGEECIAENVSILLGPAANIKRSPLCGRNFEYFSEDPYLSSQMAANHIKGVQSQGVGTSLKHFAANNQEHRRMTTDTIMDERTLREVYLASFEGAVKEAQPWTVMCAYNKVNGEYCSENKYLLTDILRDDWGHKGVVVSDWGAVNDRVSGLKAGLELEMPSSSGSGDRKIIEAVKKGELSEDVLDRAVERLLNIIFKAFDNRKANASYNKDNHHQLARKAASESMVLLKNEDNILPLRKEGTIGVIGAFAKNPRYQGGGSSHINPTKLDNIYDEIEKTAGGSAKILYAEGYKLDSDDIDEALIDEAKKVAKKSDVVVLFAGLPDRYESEGYDRVHMSMPESHIKLIEAVAEVQSNVVVVLSNGSPIEMPWINKVKGVLEAYLGGQALGGAIADLLFGIANPCGKLAETFPQKLSNNPSYLNFPGKGDRVEYREGLFVGYKYYDAKEIEPLFPFGFGLSYTTFEYSDISLDKKEMNDKDTLTVRIRIKNTGKVYGKEIVQLYVSDVKSSMVRPVKELKGFEKVELQPGEEKIVTFELNKRAFAYYDVKLKDWDVESGDFEILIGKSSRDIVLKESVYVKSSITAKKTYTRNSTIGDLMDNPKGMEIISQMMKQFAPQGDSENGSDMFEAMMKDMPIRVLSTFSGGEFSDDMIDNLLQSLNL